MLCVYLDGLRRILCQVGLQEGPEGENSSLVDKLMLSDSKLWKGEIFQNYLWHSPLTRNRICTLFITIVAWTISEKHAARK